MFQTKTIEHTKSSTVTDTVTQTSVSLATVVRTSMFVNFYVEVDLAFRP